MDGAKVCNFHTVQQSVADPENQPLKCSTLRSIVKLPNENGEIEECYKGLG